MTEPTKLCKSCLLHKRPVAFREGARFCIGCQDKIKERRANQGVPVSVKHPRKMRTDAGDTDMLVTHLRKIGE